MSITDTFNPIELFHAMGENARIEPGARWFFNTTPVDLDIYVTFVNNADHIFDMYQCPSMHKVNIDINHSLASVLACTATKWRYKNAGAQSFDWVAPVPGIAHIVEKKDGYYCTTVFAVPPNKTIRAGKRRKVASVCIVPQTDMHMYSSMGSFGDAKSMTIATFYDPKRKCIALHAEASA